MRKKIWLCFDAANGDGLIKRDGGHHYVWWFDSKKDAQERIDHHKRNGYVELVGPFKYVRESNGGQ